LGCRIEGVVVEIDLGVDGQHLAVVRDHERIDLGERRIEIDERGRELGADAGDLERQARFLHRANAIRRACHAGNPRSGSRCSRGSSRGRAPRPLDVDAALGRHHQNRTLGLAIERDADIDLARHVDGAGDEHRAHRQTFDLQMPECSSPRCALRPASKRA
jgi:hypothetical protein